MEPEENKDTSRRNFLIKSAKLAAGTIIGGTVLSACLKQKTSENTEKVKLMDECGNLVEVEKGHVMSCCAPSAKEVRTGIPNRHFVMVIDLSRCRNARQCTNACSKMHKLPPHQEFIKIFLMQDSEDLAPYWMPKPCFHCDAPPCVNVCPVGATFKRDDGIVLIDNERCIGCKFCMNACPYSSRVFNWKEPKAKVKSVYSPETSIPSRIGTVGKCDFCPDSAKNGILPDCVTACPNGVIFYGDKKEDVVTNGTDTFRFSELVKNKAAYRYEEELGTRPNVYYLPPVDRNFPVETGFKNLPEDMVKAYKVKRAHLKKFNIKS